MTLLRALGQASLLILVTVAAPACGGGKQAQPDHPVVIIGIDGLEWRILEPLLQQGKLPNLRRLVQNGSSGYLYTLRPGLSPAIWTSVATGVKPQRHGITDFIARPQMVPYTSQCRNGRALWNIAGLFGLKTLCVGWWMTWPAEEIDGWMVAPYSSGGQNDQNWKGNLRKDFPDQTWPRQLFDEIYPFAERLLDEKTFLEKDRPFFGDVELSRLDQQEQKLVGQTRWTVSADTAFSAVACYLLEKPEIDPDLTMVYLGGPDVASHRFWRYRTPEEFSYEIAGDSIEQLQEIIHRFYMQADRMVGEILTAAPQDANVIICSDHGFHAIDTEVPNRAGFSAHHLDGPPGVVILSGPDFRMGKGAEALLDPDSPRPILQMGRIYEVAPLVLYLLDIPLARRMEIPDGGSLVRKGVVQELLERRPPQPTVDTHNEGFRPAVPPKGVSAEVTNDILDWMNELGYLEGVDTGKGYTESLPGKNQSQDNAENR